MKKLIVPVLMLLLFAACQKNEKVTPNNVTQNPTKDTIAKVTYDTIADNSTMVIRLMKDSLYGGWAELYFNHTYHLYGIEPEDAGPSIQFTTPQVSFYSLSSDGKDLTIDGIPFTRGMVINMDATVLSSGNYFIGAEDFFRIPADVHPWLRDTYLKDSLDLRTGNYPVTIDNSNPATYGQKRFQIILK